jgi:hypothetical protein
MLKIQRSANGRVVFTLSGRIEAEDVKELRELVAGELLFRLPQGMQHCCILSSGLSLWPLILKALAPDSILARDRGRVIDAQEPPHTDIGSRTCRRNCFRSLGKIHDVSTELLAFTLLFTLAILLSGCRSEKTPRAPTIEFTKIPPAAQGGRERVDNVAGRVTGAHPGQQIVVYARSGPWWVQPWPDKPLIPIQADSTWSTETHLGFEYAAMLVEPTFRPPPTMDLAPTQGGSVVAVTIVKGEGAPQLAPVKPLNFSGYEWKVRTIAGDRGGLNNLYDGDNAWVDASGALHLRINKKRGRWACAEVELTRSLGYGTYVVVMRDTTHLDPAVVLSMNTFDDWGGDQHYRELDIELGRWGDPSSRNNAQYGVQPFYVPGNVAPFTVPKGALTHSLHWESGRASFKTIRGPSM